MKLDLEGALHDIAWAATRSAHPVPVDHVRARMRRRRAAATAGATVAGAGAAGAVVLASTTWAASPPAPEAVRPAAPSADSVATPDPDPSPVAGWVAGPAPCGETFALAPVDHAYVELVGQATHGSPDERGWFIPGLGEDWLALRTSVTPDVLGESLDHDGAPEMFQVTVLVDAAGTVAAWDHPDEPIREFTDGSGTTNAAGLYDAVDCRTGQPLAGEYRVFAVVGEGTEPRVDGDLGPLGEVAEYAPLAFGVGQDQGWTWESSQEWAPRLGDSLEEALARAPEPELTVELDTDHLEVNMAGVSGPAVLRSTDAALTGVVPQHLRAFLVDGQGRISQGVSMGSHPSARELDLADGAPVEVHQWWELTFDQRETTDAVVGAEYDLYVWDVVPAAGPDGVVRDRLALSEPVRVTMQPWPDRNAG